MFSFDLLDVGGWAVPRAKTRPKFVNRLFVLLNVNNELSVRMLEQIADKKTMEGRMMNESLGAAAAHGLRSQLRQFLSKLAVSPKQKIECRLCWE